MSGLATGVPCADLVDRCTCRHKYAVLAARECAMLGPGVVGDGGMPRLVLCAAVVCHCALLWARRRRHPRPAHCPVFAAVGSLRPGCSGGRGNVSPPHPCPSSLGPPSVAVVTPGFFSPRLNSAPPGVLAPCGDSTLRPLRGRTPVGFLPLWRPCGPPPRPPLWGTRGPLRRPHVPRRCPTLPRFCRLYFPACLRFSPFATALPHGGPALPPCRRPRRGIYQCCPRRPIIS